MMLYQKGDDDELRRTMTTISVRIPYVGDSRQNEDLFILSVLAAKQNKTSLVHSLDM